MQIVTEKKIKLDKDAIKSLDVSHLAEQSLNKNDWLTAGQSEYRLYAWLSTQFNNTTILDVGTRTGGSALALSYNETNKVISYDLVEQGASSGISKSNVEFKIQDFRNDDTLDFDKISMGCIETISSSSFSFNSPSKCLLANGQSDTTNFVFLFFICLAVVLPYLTAAFRVSFITPKVPPCPAHLSTTSTLVSGRFFSISNALFPIF